MGLEEASLTGDPLERGQACKLRRLPLARLTGKRQRGLTGKDKNGLPDLRSARSNGEGTRTGLEESGCGATTQRGSGALSETRTQRNGRRTTSEPGDHGTSAGGCLDHLDGRA